MSEATVFVDDAVVGRLPSLCVKEGVPTDDRFVARCPVRSSSYYVMVAVLMLLGPVGWVAFVVLSVLRRDATLTVRVPFSEPAYRRFKSIERESIAAGGITLVLLLVAAISLSAHPTHGAVYSAAAGALAVLTGTWWVKTVRATRAAGIGIELDASRRWVHIRRVHPNFAEAVDRDREYSRQL